MHSAIRRRLIPLVALTMLVPLLAACAPEREPLAENTATPMPSATTDPGITPPPVDATGTPIALDCTELISLQQMYDYNPSFLLVPSYSAEPNSAAVEAFGYHGRVCAWENTSSGDLIVLSVADLPNELLDEIRADLDASSAPASGFGADGFFANDGTTGRADAFIGSYWVTVESNWFLVATDAQPLVAAAVASLDG